MFDNRQTLIERAGFKALYKSSESQGEALAAVPHEIDHFALESFFERSVQAELVQLLLLKPSSPGFMSCVLVHGMGGTGKTVTGEQARETNSYT